MLVLVGLLAVVPGAHALAPGAAVMRVSSDSMAPTLTRGDHVVVLPVEEPHRGDLVVFDDPGGWREAVERIAGPADSVFVKRVIGLPGDHVVCCDPSGRVEVDGRPLEEPYVVPSRSRTLLAFDVTVGPAELWVLGDNRDASVDSRYLTATPGRGMVALEDVRGTVRWSF
ncbi:hypothetical protein GCM10009795_004030 [Nocardioides hankookensis]